MTNIQKPYEMIADYITGESVPNIGSEENRQAVERLLVEEKGYDKSDILVDADIEVMFKGQPYKSTVDLVVCVGDTRFMAVKCVAGAIETWEREILAAARVFEKDYQLPYCVVCDGKSALVVETPSGRRLGDSLESIFSKEQAENLLKSVPLASLAEKRRDKEQIIFRSYDLENVNVKRNIQNSDQG